MTDFSLTGLLRLEHFPNPIAFIPLQLGMISLVTSLGFALSALMYFKAYRIGRVPVLIKPQGRSQKPIDFFWYPYKGTPKYSQAYQQVYWGSFCLVSSLMLLVAAVSPTAYVGVAILVMIGCIATFISFVLLSSDLAEVVLWSTALVALPLVFILVQSITGPSGLATLAAFISGGLISIPFSTAVMKRVRSHPRFWCSSCKRPLQTLHPQDLFAYLTGSEKLAQKQDRVMFEGLECPCCSDPTVYSGIHIRAYIKPHQPSLPLLPPAPSTDPGWKVLLNRLQYQVQAWVRSQLPPPTSAPVKGRAIAPSSRKINS
ncbi:MULTISPECIES: hypothetical protein [unclassified Roseofilum]|uniref:hypothetical protein n=1 Tax=unclassified Roseofilum TaxID=2620099 RepID=UPI001B23F124|nr:MULTISPECIES: hypothetical protein [unclassified Roseofilum]MBP0011409.1 hypothetical protein [Roseofilum sp. Belize Diploria]MBP0035942.1 hypothetical protein [Roseofilum sp. Belize BBD 4]